MEHPEIIRIKQQIDDMADLPDNWSAHGSLKPNAWAIQWAKIGVECCMTLHLSPHTSPSAEEGVYLGFYKGNSSGNIEFFNDEEIVAAISNGSDDVQVWEVKPYIKDILDAFTRIKDYLEI